MVRRSEKCLGSRMKKSRTNEDNPILLDDYEDEKISSSQETYEENQMNYKPIQTVYPGDDEYDITGPNDTQIVLYNENLASKRKIKVETSFQKLDAQGTENSEGSKNTELPVEESDESDEDNVPIVKRKLYTEMKKSKRIYQESQKNKRKLSDEDKAKQGHTGKKTKVHEVLKRSVEKSNTTNKSKVQKDLKRSVESKKKAKMKNWNVEKRDANNDLNEVAPLILKRNKWSRSQKLSIYARLDVITNIKKKLNREQIEIFRSSPFGNFLDLKITKFQSQLLFHIIRRQCTLTKEDELLFNFESHIAKFGIREYEAITGLNCGPLLQVNMEKLKGRLLGKYFKNEDIISRSRLTYIFNDSKKVKDEDRVKLAKIYFLENFLLGKQLTTGIDVEHIKLVDDEIQFDSYPWGRIGYQVVIDSIKKSIKNPLALAVGISGFAYAILVWAYECIPLLSGPSMFCAKRVGDSNLCMLNWIVDTHPKWKELAERVFDTNQFAFKGLFPDEDVMEGSMFHGTETRNFEKGECSKESEGINTQIPEYFLTFQEIMLTNNEELNKKLDKLIGEVEEIKNKLTNRSSSMTEEENWKEMDEDRDGGNGERDDRLVNEGENGNTENINMDEEGDRTTIVNSENEAARDGQNESLDDMVYNTALLKEVEQIEKEAPKMKTKKLEKRHINQRGAVKNRTVKVRESDIFAYNQLVRRSLRRGNHP